MCCWSAVPDMHVVFGQSVFRKAASLQLVIASSLMALPDSKDHTASSAHRVSDMPTTCNDLCAQACGSCSLDQASEEALASRGAGAQETQTGNCKSSCQTTGPF